jgi:acyl-CoA synthetase (NDP forming)
LQMKELDRVFNPRSVVVVGDKRENDYMWLRSLSTFTGEVCSVQIDPDELPGIARLGVRNYHSLLDLPKPVDYAIVAVPRAVAPKIVADCIRAGVGGATLFTSGFAETGTDAGIRLEQQIAEMAKAADFPLIGPNCMGIFNPEIGLRHDINQYSGHGGSAGFISQSGTHAIFFSLVGESHGVRVSKAVSYGNAAVLDSTDYLDYLADDEETRVIGMYVEGTKEGRRFFQRLRETARKKPVVVWKGGRSAEGARAAASHTGAMTSAPVLWETAVRQCGAVKVDSLEEMIDVVKGLLYLRPPSGNRVGLVAHSGGQSVVITDACVQEGLDVPMLSDRSYEEFASFFSVVGGSYLNPLDVSWNVLSLEDLRRSLDIVSRDENVDSVVVEICIPFLSQIWEYYPPYLDSLLELLSDFNRGCPKCFLVALVAGQMEAEASEVRRKLIDAGIASFPTFGRVARALRKVTDYHALQREPG